jgi:hypothetical protein
MAPDPSGNPDEEEPSAEDDHEVTPVGHASKVLLELSSSGDQNTRAYQAPRELLELARRKQAARAAQTPSQAPVIRPAEDDAAPPRPIGESLPPRERPTHKPARARSVDEASAPSISVEPASSSLEALDSFEAARDTPASANDAAPSVARSRPSRALSENPGAAPASSSAREASHPSAPSSLAAPGVPPSVPESAAASSASSPTPRLPLSALAVIVGICLAIGFILAKWRGLELLLRRH